MGEQPKIEKFPVPGEVDPQIEKVAQLRKEFEEVFYRVIEYPRTAFEVLQRCQGAAPFFELGLKWGQEDSEEIQKLLIEIREKLSDKEQQVGQQLYPVQYPRKKKETLDDIKKI